MKRFIVIVVSLIITNTLVNSQVTPFKFELGGLYGIPTDKDAYSAGVGLYVNPSYYLADQLNVGVKAELAIIGSADALGSDVSISAIGSYLATCNYYFTVSKIRPYAGVGVGIYTLGTASGSNDLGEPYEYDFGNKFGVAPKLGLDLGHFTINVSYNMIFGLEDDNDKNYMTAGIGIFFGGGVKGKSSKKNRIISIEEDEDF